MNVQSLQDHHHLPKAYLKGWCVDDALVRYRRMGRSAKLVRDSRGTKGVGFEPNLYTVPAGGLANGLSGQQVEARLASTIDDELRGIVARASPLVGQVVDMAIREDLVWLMQTFIARSPAMVESLDTTVSEFLRSQQDVVERLLARSALESTRQELRKFLDPRAPRTTALAGVAAVAEKEVPATWVDGELHVVPARLVATHLCAIGAGEFATFEEPVVSWDGGPSGLLASLAVSADAMVLVFERGSAPTEATYGEIVQRHTLAPLKLREMLICRTDPTGALLAAAGELRPWRERPR